MTADAGSERAVSRHSPDDRADGHHVDGIDGRDHIHDGDGSDASDARVRGPAAIETVDLSRAYGDVVALAPLDLVVSAGERVSLIGHNGSGKTTLLRLACGLTEPSTGSITIAGHPVESVEARAAVSWVSDRPVFYDDLSLAEHLEYVARLHRTDDRDDVIEWITDRLALDERIDQRPGTFSRGWQQRAALAIAFVRPFEVLLVDEPFVGLDRSGRRALLDLVEWAHGDGATVIVATHELGTVRSSDRVIALADGQVVHDGPAGAADLDDLVERGAASRHATDRP